MVLLQCFSPVFNHLNRFSNRRIPFGDLIPQLVSDLGMPFFASLIQGNVNDFTLLNQFVDDLHLLHIQIVEGIEVIFGCTRQRLFQIIRQ